MINFPKEPSPEEKEKLRKQNEQASKEAVQRAREQEEADLRAGKKPIASEIADSVRRKLENNEFQTREPEQPKE